MEIQKDTNRRKMGIKIQMGIQKDTNGDTEIQMETQRDTNGDKKEYKERQKGTYR